MISMTYIAIPKIHDTGVAYASILFSLFSTAMPKVAYRDTFVHMWQNLLIAIFVISLHLNRHFDRLYCSALLAAAAVLTAFLYKRRAVAARTARSRVNLYTHCLGIVIPGQVVYLSRNCITEHAVLQVGFTKFLTVYFVWLRLTTSIKRT